MMHGIIRLQRGRQRAALLTLFFIIFNVTLTSVAEAQSIVPYGNTETVVDIDEAAGVTNITTSTLIGGGLGGLNTFSRFDVAQDHTVNLILPDGTQHLVNLVYGHRSVIDGVVNSIKDGEIGGNLYFLNPHGIVVGETGVINVGALALGAPTQAFMDGFFVGGQAQATSVNAVLQGNVPVSPTGLVTVRGTINAAGDIRLFGGDVVNTGVVTTGAAFEWTEDNFTDVVNVAGLSGGAGMVVENGTIRIVAADEFVNEGTIAADGGPGVDAGNIQIEAGSRVVLQSGSLITAQGQGDDSADGNVTITVSADDTSDGMGGVTQC